MRYYNLKEHLNLVHFKDVSLTIDLFQMVRFGLTTAACMPRNYDLSVNPLRGEKWQTITFFLRLTSSSKCSWTNLCF